MFGHYTTQMPLKLSGIHITTTIHNAAHAAHVQGVCAPNPVSPGRLVLIVFVGASDIQLSKVRQISVIPDLPRTTCRI